MHFFTSTLLFILSIHLIACGGNSSPSDSEKNAQLETKSFKVELSDIDITHSHSTHKLEVKTEGVYSEMEIQ